jgi:hypothetical protein
MFKHFYLNIFILIFFVLSTSSAQIGRQPGSFARMGFGARGMGMGNALSSLATGEISSYYNPALVPFSESKTASVSFSIMPLDRNLNFLSYSQAVKPTAGLSVGLINAGVSNIDGRDNDGYQTENLSTSENQFYLAFGNKVHERVSLGITIKLYYYKLFENVSSSTVGFDAGALVKINDQMAVGLVIQDLGSKYKWDTGPIYGKDGAPTTDYFPRLYRLAYSYRLPNNFAAMAFEYERSSAKTTSLKIGAEANLHEYFTIRTGIDRWNPSEKTEGIKPTFGFTFKKPFENFTPQINYAYVIEPFSIGGIHVISLSAIF